MATEKDKLINEMRREIRELKKLVDDLLHHQKVVQCKDCKHFNDGDCTELPKISNEYDFCSWGERK